MKEYADLKFSLLAYDLALVLSGFTVLTLLSYEKEAYAFLFGGFCGFLYLILLQRSVDAIPGPELYPQSGKVQNSARRPLLVLTLVIAASAVAVKYGSADASFVLTPAQLFAGAAGFWANKISVLLSAASRICHHHLDHPMLFHGMAQAYDFCLMLWWAVSGTLVELASN